MVLTFLFCLNEKETHTHWRVCLFPQTTGGLAWDAAALCDVDLRPFSWQRRGRMGGRGCMLRGLTCHNTCEAFCLCAPLLPPPLPPPDPPFLLFFNLSCLSVHRHQKDPTRQDKDGWAWIYCHSECPDPDCQLWNWYCSPVSSQADAQLNNFTPFYQTLKWSGTCILTLNSLWLKWFVILSYYDLLWHDRTQFDPRFMRCLWHKNCH